MGVTKTQLFTERHNEIAALSKALGHPARVAIMELLSETEGCICGDLVEETGLAQPTVSQHLAVLKQVGLIQGTINGNKKCYCINYTRWQNYKSIMTDFLHHDAKSLDECCK